MSDRKFESGAKKKDQEKSSVIAVNVFLQAQNNVQKLFQFLCVIFLRTVDEILSDINWRF